MPYTEDLARLPHITQEIIQKKINKFSRGIVPEHTQRLVLDIDPGGYLCWWTLWAFWGYRMGALVEYGQFTVPQGLAHLDIAIETSISEFYNTTVLQGWKKGLSGPLVTPDLMLIDAGFHPKAIYRFVLKNDPQQTKIRATVGEGSSENRKWSAKDKDKKAFKRNWFVTKRPNGILLVHMNSDFWKEQVHLGFMAPMTGNGSLSVYHVEKAREHVSYARQIAAEKKDIRYTAGGREFVTWVKTSRNHYFDSTYGAVVGADMLGMRMTEEGQTKRVIKKSHGPENPYKIGR
jgi:hypothetical protein